MNSSNREGQGITEPPREAQGQMCRKWLCPLVQLKKKPFYWESSRFLEWNPAVWIVFTFDGCWDHMEELGSASLTPRGHESPHPRRTLCHMLWSVTRASGKSLFPWCACLGSGFQERPPSWVWDAPSEHLEDQDVLPPVGPLQRGEPEDVHVCSLVHSSVTTKHTYPPAEAASNRAGDSFGLGGSLPLHTGPLLCSGPTECPLLGSASFVAAAPGTPCLQEDDCLFPSPLASVSPCLWRLHTAARVQAVFYQLILRWGSERSSVRSPPLHVGGLKMEGGAVGQGVQASLEAGKGREMGPPRASRGGSRTGTLRSAGEACGDV